MEVASAISFLSDHNIDTQTVTWKFNENLGLISSMYVFNDHSINIGVYNAKLDGGFLFTCLHEYRHVIQVKNGWLKPAPCYTKVEFLGETMETMSRDEDHFNLPHEQDANGWALNEVLKFYPDFKPSESHILLRALDNAEFETDGEIFKLVNPVIKPNTPVIMNLQSLRKYL